MLKHRLRFQAPSSEILLFSISIDLGVSLHMWKWKIEKTPTHLQRIKKVSSTVKSPTFMCQIKEHGMSLDNSCKDFTIILLRLCEFSDIRVMHPSVQLFSGDFLKQEKCTNKLFVLQDFCRHCWNLLPLFMILQL